MGARDREYNASIELMAVFPIGDSFVANDLIELVKEADALFPWQDRYVDGSAAPSLTWISDPEVREGEWIDRQYTLRFRPPFLLAYNQLHAYEQYGKGLARQIAMTITTRCLRVDSRLLVEGTFNEGFRPSRLQTNR